MTDSAKADEPEWLRIARKEIGVKEEPRGPNERINQYLETVGGHPGDDWCAAFAAWCLMQAGIRGTYSKAARNFLKVGKPLKEWKLGCLAIYWRISPNDWRGHVGFPLKKPTTTISTLGGNQTKAVCIRPYASTRLLGFVWPC